MVQAKLRKKAAAVRPAASHPADEDLSTGTPACGVASGRHGSVLALAAMVTFMLLMEAPWSGQVTDDSLQSIHSHFELYPVRLCADVESFRYDQAELALTLFVLCVFADHTNHPTAGNDLALDANLLH